MVELVDRRPDDEGREIALYLIEADSLEASVPILEEQFLPALKDGQAFSAVIVGDLTSEPDEGVATLAGWMIANGLFHISAWGAGCERTHDLFDDEDQARSPEGPWVMTMWHDDEPLDEVIELFWDSSIAMEGKSWGPIRLVLEIGTREWSDEIRTWRPYWL